jgi:hypothetical protein
MMMSVISYTPSASIFSKVRSLSSTTFVDSLKKDSIRSFVAFRIASNLL